MIDLHAHTTASDGAASPAGLIDEAMAHGLEALSICDHDTLAGYQAAAAPARAAGLDLVCGIELSTKLREHGKPPGLSIHLLAYFLDGAPSLEFQAWLEMLKNSRRERNSRLLEKLLDLGVDIRMEDVQALAPGLPGRPHFARVLLRTGYAPDIEAAFRMYLGEHGRAYVPRRSPDVAEGIRQVLEAGGVPVLAHPRRLAQKLGERQEEIISRFRDWGLRGIEIYHSEHSNTDIDRYRMLARRYELLETGGSDYHGDYKPEVRLGMGSTNNGAIPREILDALRKSAGA